MPMQLIRTMTFCAAHRTPDAPEEAARRLHGHIYHVDLILSGPVDERRGWLVDFGDVKRAFAPVAEALDHAYLNAIEGLESGGDDALAAWIHARLKPALPQLARVRVRTRATPFAPRRLPAEPALGLPERLAIGIEAAHRLPHCGEGHKCLDLHGHSFELEVGAADLDRLVAPLAAVHDRLDHRLLNDIEGLENPTSERLAAWIWDALRPAVPGLRVVVVRESPECACLWRGEP